MNRYACHLSLLFALLSCSTALAQIDSSTPTAPSPAGSVSSRGATSRSSSPPPPTPQADPTVTPAAATSATTSPSTPSPTPDPPATQPTAPNAPPPSPLPYPYDPPPEEPIYQPPRLWRAEPSLGLGLVPGDGNLRWDISVDALWLTRDAGNSIALGSTSYNHASHTYQAVPTDSLWTDDVFFPLEPGIRLQAIYRVTDQMSVEATGWGLQQWSVGRTIYGDPAQESVLAQSPWLPVSYLVGGFDNTLSYTYNSQVANVELNQRFKLLSFDPYRSLSWLWGVRYLYLSDDFTLSGSDLYTNSYESVNWQTANNLIGAQLGLQWTWGWNRFQLSTELKGGLFANVYSQHGVDSGTPISSYQPFDVSHNGTDLAALIELSLLARFRISSNVWVRAGYQCYGVTGLALGPRQLGSTYDASGSVGLDGLSLGLELTR